jgi:hypothetical protein
LGAVVGTIVGLAMSKTGADKGLTNLCDSFSNALFPPTMQANILTGATDTLTNNMPAARAAGAISSHVAPAGTELEQPEPEPEASYLDMAESFFSQMWRPTVATPSPYKRVMAAPTKGNIQIWERLKLGKYFNRPGKLPPGNKCRR